MNKRFRLSDDERVFFNTVSAATFANPFSLEREALNSRIAGAEGKGDAHSFAGALAGISGRIAALEKQGVPVLPRYEGSDRELLSVVLLFDTFHRYIPEFDRHILDQLAAGKEPLKAPFAAGVLSELERRGFSGKEASVYFAVFYQLRRAFYFIQTLLTGTSPCMRTLRERLWRNVFTGKMEQYVRSLWNRMEDFSTLLLGETGTGKGVAAQALGRSGYIPFSVRRGCFEESFMRSFVALNLSQFPESLIESELFGHQKGHRC